MNTPVFALLPGLSTGSLTACVPTPTCCEWYICRPGLRPSRPRESICASQRIFVHEYPMPKMVSSQLSPSRVHPRLSGPIEFSCGLTARWPFFKRIYTSSCHKIAGKSGQISLGKSYAGKTLRLERFKDGRIVLTAVAMVPKASFGPWRSQIAPGSNAASTGRPRQVLRKRTSIAY